MINVAKWIKLGRLAYLIREPQEDLASIAPKEITMINGRPYRMGFLNAFWGPYEPNDPRSMLRAKRQNVLSSNQELYHYTSIAGLKGIIEENGLWASDNRFMNDTDENWNGIRLAQEVLRHKTKRSRDAAFIKILHEVEGLIAAPKENGNYIVCFSTIRDDLGQWRGYAAGGVCLRFDQSNNEFGEREAFLFFGPDHLPHEAIYDGKRKRTLLLAIIRDFEREYAADRVAMSDHLDTIHDEQYTKNLYLKISHAILGFKNQAFSNEAEVRLIIPYENVNRYEGSLRFRASAHGILPYLRTGDHHAIKKNGGRLPLREVIVGPAPRQDLIAQSIDTFMRENGYSNIVISLSKVPYRSP